MTPKLLIRWYRFRPPQIPESYDQVLRRFSEYYRDLGPELKTRFRHRLFLWLKWARFESENLPAITDEMRILVGSAFVQITFGLKEYLFREFRHIVIVPQAYSYRWAAGKTFMGDVNAKKRRITLSWPHVQTGFEIPDDAANVALHEVAHALSFEQKLRTEDEPLFKSQALATWESEARATMKAIRSQKVLRAYAGADQEELFAVSVETFFEQPQAFQRELPELYAAMCRLLNQNPINAEAPIG
ncbi:zinc-dependent peptidase [Pontibacter sp. G13]|uniref:zinc-dependent peptidase n=1 Tax=Pontibacter sp. G13 TaxID=3074898 RepID=UPI00288A9F59|nr:zinc-dependent peptidase [Pontibacter sp. G13]WNJ20738.1 zinc-dependent peptidase [Pontibacter sp. G13]